MSKYDRIMKKCNYFYKYPKKEELYNFHSTIINFLLPRLQLFLDESDKYIDWDYHKEHGVDVEQTIRTAIRKLEYIKENEDASDVKIAERCANYAKDVLSSLGDIFFYLWY